MTATHSRQPDDPGPSGESFRDALIFNGTAHDVTPNTIKVIRKNAGRMPPLELAAAIGWRYRRLKNFCAAMQPPVDLRYPPSEPPQREPRGA